MTTTAGIDKVHRPAGDGDRIAIRVDGVAKSFGENRALVDVSCSLAEGRTLGVLGHNGSGKTTLTRLLSGLLTPDAGAVSVLGRDPTVDGAAVRRELGVLPSTHLVDGRMTVWENLMFAARMFGVQEKSARQRATDLLDRFDLADRARSRVGQLSAGMTQKASLARVLVTDPRLLVLDEPTSALDPVAAREFRDLIEFLVGEEGRSAVLCTHDLDEASRLCDEVVILDRGSVVARGTPGELGARVGGTAVARIRVGKLPSSLPPGVVPTGDTTVEVPAADDAAVARAVAGLAGAGVPIYEVEREHGSLEEFYLRLFAAADRRETEQGDDNR